MIYLTLANRSMLKKDTHSSGSYVLVGRCCDGAYTERFRNTPITSLHATEELFPLFSNYATKNPIQYAVENDMNLDYLRSLNGTPEWIEVLKELL